ncbi:MAG: protein tyrosine phosphatase, partial [Candidatus Electrothrix sp. AR4]|nr:protein tyrosine phosphatase [Candidatus Electrothrix sp. AR4]
MNKYIIILFLIIPTACFSEPRLRPDTWGKPVIGTELKNIYFVDKGIYRSEQPGQEDQKNLHLLGIKEVLNLRRYHSDKDDITDKNIKLHRVKMSVLDITE